MLHANAVLRSQVAQVALEISAMDTALEEKRAELKRLQHQLDAVTYPVLSLPPEITSEIFKQCLPTFRSQPDGIDPMQAPLLVSHVCSQWRQIALSTPALWKDSLDIDLALRRRLGSNIVDTWLARAQQCPLSVRIQGPGYDYDEDSIRFFERFRRHVSRMEFLDLDLYPAVFPEKTWPIEFPLLRKLSILTADYEVPHDLAKMFGNVPQLSQVRLARFPAEIATLPWEQFQKFTGEFYELSQCLDALRLMPNIVECTFSVHETRVGNNGHDMVSHSKIRTFTLSQSIPLDETEDHPRSAQLLAFITLPNLEILELLDIEGYDAHILASFLGRGSPPLKQIVLRPHLGSGQTDLILDMAPLREPRFKYLEIWYPEKGFVSRFFECFGQDSGFLPGLEKLSFYCRGRKSRKKEASQRDVLLSAAESFNSRKALTGVNQLLVLRARRAETTPVER
ncbi:hypothetical protein FB45DRAFT_1055414 [Roridomyces roridus]|uniref:F-box domain-containing protein n=1 Tax=Roridomyces roridus TaxID=1738132 RepID=A0AAD7C5F9_9AGAR|nr:hypothetical protein FB45DRAFT_1055414 [Roridomyces roridus]